MSVLLVAASTATATVSKFPFLKRKRFVIPAIVLLVIFALVWWLASPLFINVTVNEPFPFTADSTEVVASGQFTNPSGNASGNALLLQQAYERILRFEAFQVSNGPVLKVYLVEDVNGTNNQTFGDYVDLGSLSGNIGNQNYIIPSDVNLETYSGVVIYCELFHVVFSAARFDS